MDTKRRATGAFEDKVGKIFVVLHPSRGVEFGDIFIETTLLGFVTCLDTARFTVGKIYGIYSQKDEAVDVAHALLAAGASHWDEDA